MNRSTPGLPVRHQHREFTQTHVHGVSDAIQPSPPLVPFSSCPQSLSASGSFPVSQLFASGVLWLDYYYFCLPWLLPSVCTFAPLWLNLLSDTWGRPRRLELSSKWEAGVGPGGWGSLSPRRRLRKLLRFSSRKSVRGRRGLWERGTDSWEAAEGEISSLNARAAESEGWHNSRTGRCRPSDL